MPVELKVIQDFYDLMLYLIQRVEKFPRHHRYSLGHCHREPALPALVLSMSIRVTIRTPRPNPLCSRIPSV